MSEVLSESNSVNVDTKKEENLEKKAKLSTAEFYQTAENYWNTQPATVDGMLGGYESISDTDIEQSQKFLSHFLQVILQTKEAMVSQSRVLYIIFLAFTA
jgi:hypothetical protein